MQLYNLLNKMEEDNKVDLEEELFFLEDLELDNEGDLDEDDSEFDGDEE